ncbi:putative membrane protein [Microterricola gilva]|uniref:Putative membrane protein n=1 Tax=Microterricola gilva TaxID=393267 RepID=A0A4Q8ALE4_9MICO|nr:SHOCT domain-containing protein [Microterricola gilva]RZU65382.1 putative membrane protein [Microterricola gilva]
MFTTLMSSPAIATVAAHPYGWGGPSWLFILIPIFWITLFVLFFVFMGRRWRGRGYGPHGWAPTVSAEQTLSERYARGDIDETEYRARLEVLRANRPER